ncbi:MAG: hypothetical protein R2712_22300 [Vicinamibacterales bacterium]
MRIRRVSITGTVVAAAIVATTACMGGGGGRRPAVTSSRPAPAADAPLQGTWELMSVDAQGRSVPASGRLSFDAFNNISMRVELPPDLAEVTPPRVVLLDFAAKAVVSGGDLSYVGVQRRGSPEEMIPSAADPSTWRHFSVEGDTLRIWNDSGGQIGTLTFKRAG